MIKGMISSLIPNTAPAREKMVINIGMRRALTRGDRSWALARVEIPALIAPVRCRMPKTPPTSRTNPIISEASTNPRIGAMRMAPSPCGSLSISWKVPGITILRPSTCWVSKFPPGIIQVNPAMTIRIAKRMTKVSGDLFFVTSLMVVASP